MDLAINYLQFCEVIWNLMQEQSLEFLDCKRVDLIVLVYNRLEVLNFGKTFNYNCKFVTCHTTVAKQNSIHLLVVDKLARFCDSYALSFTQHVVL